MTFEEVYQDLGVFRYDAHGFTFSYRKFVYNTFAYKKFVHKVDWNEITCINAHKRDLLTEDQIVMEIICGDRSFSISEDTPGWYQFILRLKAAFPAIPKDWEECIVLPAFAPNFMTFYEK